MAEAFTRFYSGRQVEPESAGTHPVGINPNAKWVMNEVGLDLSHQTSDPLSIKDLTRYDWVITLCGAARDSCPVLPAGVQSEHWPLPDPASIRGKPNDVISGFRVIRYQIEHRVKDLLARLACLSDRG